MNDHSIQERLKQPAPPPSPEAMEEAWSAAAVAFRRGAGSGHPVSRWIRPVAAAAAIAILCGIIAVRPWTDRSTVDGPKPAGRVDMVALFSQGRELFGDRLQAVTMAKDLVVWHLSEDSSPGPASDQVVTLTLERGTASRLHIAVSPGAPMDVDQAGRIFRVEFLPDAAGRIMAVGDGIYWDAETPGSPMMEPRLRELCLNE